MFDMRKSNQNGQAFQKRIESILNGYRKKGIADLQKVDPPVRVMGGGKFRKVIFMENPWLDYSGAWATYGGRSLHIEAKWTQELRLPFGGKSGLRPPQIQALRRWHNAGAVVAVVWGCPDGVALLTFQDIEGALEIEAKSIKWRHLQPCARGMGLIEFDLLAELEYRLGLSKSSDL